MPPESPAVMRTVWHAALVEAAGGAEERAGVRTRGITRLARVCQVAARTGDKRPERSRGYGGELFYMCICENINPRDFFARGRPVPGRRSRCGSRAFERPRSPCDSTVP